jgi:hypothetical protein
VQNITSNKKYHILSKINTHCHTNNVQHLFTKPFKTLRAQVDARRLGRENKMAEEFVREGLPNNSGSEKEIIAYDYQREL